MAQSNTSTSKVSVVVVNYNGEATIGDCLKSIYDSTHKNLEVVVIDNCSSDSSIRICNAVGVDYIWANESNAGPACALNQGIDMTEGDYVLFLASDTKLHPDCISELAYQLDTYPKVGIASAMVVHWEKYYQLDSAGEFINQFGLLVQRHKNHELDPKYFVHHWLTEIFSAKGTAIMYRRSTKLYYDNDYFIFLEDTDFCWRMWLAGYEVLFVPQALIYHKVSSALSGAPPQWVRYYGTRNYITTHLKNMGFARLVWILPLHVLLWVMFSLRVEHGWAIWRGIGWNFLHWKEVMAKRKEVQSKRKITDKELFSRVMVHTTIGELIEKTRGAK
jgi:GT2 family glycosyltransferase